MADLLSTVSYSASTSGGAAVGIFLVVYVAIYLLAALGLYGTFKKAGQPGWAGFVPFYNVYIMLKMVGRPGWWLILYFIPFVNIVISILVYYDVSKSFGHGGAFTVGLVFLAPIFFYILWLGPSRYLGPAAQMTAGVPPGYPGQGYPAQPQPGYGAQGYPAQPQPGYGAQGYPAQPQPGYPAQPQPPPAAPPGPPQQPPPGAPPQ